MEVLCLYIFPLLSDHLHLDIRVHLLSLLVRRIGELDNDGVAKERCQFF